MSHIPVIQWLVQKNLVKTPQQAQKLIEQGQVYRNGYPVEKISTRVHLRDCIFISDKNAVSYVSRGGFKLASGFQILGESVASQWYVDVGASTGGFTDYLLRQGAAGVIAIDVGHHQLHEKLRSDPRVICMEDIHIQKIKVLPKLCYRCVADVSFISLKMIFPIIWDLLSAPRWCMLLFKPQFELPRKYVQPGGVVEDDGVVDQHLRAFMSHIETQFQVSTVVSVPCKIRGKKKKNQEYWVLVKE